MFQIDNATLKRLVEESVKNAKIARVKYETNSCWAKNMTAKDEVRGVYSCDELMVSPLGLCAYHHHEITGRRAE